ncbi:MAG: ABC transporter ATP-binding protein [Rhodothermia bacterium]|nr:ABC transporter ATP-binding protein [Rhodothermia bacterium]
MSSLSRRFGDVLAVDDLSLDIRQGEVFGLLGHNGAGKTTTIRILNGILDPSAGSVRVMDLDPRRDGAELRRRTGVLTETPALDDRLTGRENLEIFAHLYRVPANGVDATVSDLLDKFQLSHRADQRVHTYSKGMKQRLALARTILNDPELLYLDEPTSGLDPVASHEVREMIREWGDQPHRTVFLCTHNLVEAQDLCDRVGVLERGRLRLLGTPEELTDHGDGGMEVDLLFDPDDVARAWAALKERVTVVSSSDDFGRSRDEGGGKMQAGGDDGNKARSRSRGRNRNGNGNGGRVTVRVDARADIPALVDLAASLGLPVFGVVPQVRTLRDVYLSLYIDEELEEDVRDDNDEGPDAE